MLEYLDIAAIEQPGVIGRSRTLKFSEAPSRARRRTRAGDILVSTVRPYLRNFARIRESRNNLVASTGYAVVRPRDWVDGRFLYQHIMSDDFVEFLKPRMRGSNYPAVKSADSDGFKIATVTAGDLPALLLQRVGRFRRFRDLTPGYLWQLLQSRFVKTHLQISQKGIDLPHISKSEIESAICPFPTVYEQKRMARRLEALDIYTTRLDQERKQCELLKTALISVLLTGELRVTPDVEAA